MLQQGVVNSIPFVGHFLEARRERKAAEAAKTPQHIQEEDLIPPPVAVLPWEGLQNPMSPVEGDGARLASEDLAAASERMSRRQRSQQEGACVGSKADRHLQPAAAGASDGQTDLRADMQSHMLPTDYCSA